VATIRSIGWGPLTLHDLRLTGKDGADFEIDGRDCLARPISPGLTCVVAIFFAPHTEGHKSATLAVVAEGIYGPPELALSGSAVRPSDFTLEPPRALFDPVAVGSSSDWVPVELHNISSKPLEVAQAQVSGEAPADFEFDQTNCAEAIPVDGCTVKVRFHPTVPGTRSAVVLLKDKSGEAAHDLALVGEGIVGDLSIDPPQLSFPGVALREISNPLTVRIVSEGGVAVHVGEGQFTGDAGDDFRVVRNTCKEKGSDLKNGVGCELDVTFAPKKEGPRRASLSLLDDAFDGPHVINVEGTGIRPRTPEIQIVPPTVAFGLQPVRAKVEPWVIQVYSRGEAPLHIGTVDLAPGGDAEFGLTSDCSGRAISRDDHCTIRIYFTPQGARKYSAQLRIPNNAPGGTRYVALDGAGYVSDKTPVKPPSNLTARVDGQPTTRASTKPGTPAGLQPGSASPAEPQLIACDDSMFRWDAVPGATSYQVAVGFVRGTARTNGLEQIVYANEVKLSPELVKLEAEKSYAWTVTAIGRSGQRGDAAEPRYIRCAVAPSRPGLKKYAKRPVAVP
jgi:hypothetical protein